VIKTLIKLAIVVLLANAIWRAGSAYLSYYKFQDAVTDVLIKSKDKTDDELRTKVMALAMEYDEPIGPEDVTIRREDKRVLIEGSYTKAVAIFPWYDYQWKFSLTADSAAGATFRRELPNP
jgi:hypothetical protein